MMVRLPLAVLAVLAAVATVSAQNGLGDECIIQVTLGDDLTTATLAFDLLFDDEAWAELTDAIDLDDDGMIDAAEIADYENRTYQVVDGRAVPDARLINLLADFSKRSYSGTVAAEPVTATNSTRLIDFEGPVTEREGKIVRETWVYRFEDPMRGYDTTIKAASSIVLAWGPEAERAPDDQVAVEETVQVRAPEGWSLLVDGERRTEHTFASGGGYRLTFVPDDARHPIPAQWMVGLLVAFVLWRR